MWRDKLAATLSYGKVNSPLRWRRETRETSDSHDQATALLSRSDRDFSRQRRPGLASTAAEARVLDYVRTHLEPGQPLMVTDLYNRVFTQPDERQALNKLYNAFFRIPLFVANYQEN